MKNNLINTKYIGTSVMLVLIYFYTSREVLADPVGFNNPLGGTTTITGLLIQIIQWTLGLSAFIAMLSLIVGGIRLIISFGNDQGLVSAKKNIQWAIIGIAVIILSYAIISMVELLLGAQ